MNVTLFNMAELAEIWHSSSAVRPFNMPPELMLILASPRLSIITSFATPPRMNMLPLPRLL